MFSRLRIFFVRPSRPQTAPQQYSVTSSWSGMLKSSASRAPCRRIPRRSPICGSPNPCRTSLYSLVFLLRRSERERRDVRRAAYGKPSSGVRGARAELYADARAPRAAEAARQVLRSVRREGARATSAARRSSVRGSSAAQSIVEIAAERDDFGPMRRRAGSASSIARSSTACRGTASLIRCSGAPRRRSSVARCRSSRTALSSAARPSRSRAR